MSNNINLLYQDPKKFIEYIEQKISLWNRKLNEVIGVTSFGIGLACLGTKYPEVFGWLGIFFILVLQYSIRSFFPKEIKYLRNKKNKNSFEEVILKGIESHFFGLRKSFKEAPLFWIGFYFLFLVATGFVSRIAEKIHKFFM